MAVHWAYRMGPSVFERAKAKLKRLEGEISIEPFLPRNPLGMTQKHINSILRAHVRGAFKEDKYVVPMNQRAIYMIITTETKGDTLVCPSSLTNITSLNITLTAVTLPLQ